MNKSKSSLFLMELILAILIFAIASAVCIQIFVRSHIISQNTQKLNQAVTLCSSSAELFYGYEGDLSKIRKDLDVTQSATVTSDSLTLYYNDSFKACDRNEASYWLMISRFHEDNLIKSDICFIETYDSNEIYSISCSLYAP